MPAHSKSGHGRRKKHRATWDQNNARNEFMKMSHAHDYKPMTDVYIPKLSMSKDYQLSQRIKEYRNKGFLF